MRTTLNYYHLRQRQVVSHRENNECDDHSSKIVTIAALDTAHVSLVTNIVELSNHKM